ncbi:MAG: BA14K family protein, partial [Pseudolabrys sp.]
PIIAPGLTPSVSSGAAAQAATEAPAAAPEPPANCNVNACTAAYRSFRAADCTYQPSDGPRRLCSK